MNPIASRPMQVAGTLCAALCFGSLTLAQQWRITQMPTDRAFHAMAFDPVRGRTVLFGGSTATGYLDDTWEHDGTRWVQVATPTSPTARAHHAMAFDPARGVVTLFGGQDGATVFGDTWDFNGVTWTLRPASPSPSPRWGHAMVCHPQAGVLLFGGAAGLNPPLTFLGDTWILTAAGWTQVPTPPALLARNRHAMAYDELRGVSVLFGGVGANGVLNDTWEFFGGNWTPGQNGPTGRYQHAMATDPATRNVVMFGGYVGTTGPTDETWHYEGTTWRRSPAIPLPAARYGSALAFDAGNNVALHLGGSDRYGVRFGDSWCYDGTAWFQTSPTPHYLQALVYDAMTQRLVMFGGQVPSGGSWVDSGETWELEGARWTCVQPPVSPPARCQHMMAYDAQRGVTVLFGGLEAATMSHFNDIWEYDGRRQTWSQVPPPIYQPSPRAASMFVYDARRGCMVLFGGWTAGPSGPMLLDDTWEYDGQTRIWTRVAPTASPPARGVTADTYDARRGVAVLYGGFVMNASSNPVAVDGTWEYDGVTRIWTRNANANQIGVRLHAHMAYDPARGRILLFGGATTQPWVAYGDTWEYDGNSWALQQPSPQPTPRFSAPMAYDAGRHRIVMIGGTQLPSWTMDSCLFEYQPVAQAAWTSYGFGCAGSVGTPTLTNRNLPTLGCTLQLSAAHLPTGPGLLLYTLGFHFGDLNGQPLPLELGAYGLPGCQLWTSLDHVGLLGYAGRTATIALPIPNRPQFAGLRFATQVLTLNTSTPAWLDAVSNAGIATVQ